ncbi:MAG: hypothetical protein RH948_08880 [Cyclobacteriaceae bacterium]
MRTKIYYFLISTLLLTSCATKQYTWVYTTHKPTFFEKKNDCEFSFNGAAIGELHGAYAITNNIAVSLTGAWGGPPGADTTGFPLFDTLNNNIGRGILSQQIQDIDFSVGYFKPLNDKWQFEVFTGLSLVSKSTTENRNYTNGFENTENVILKESLYRKYYIQPAIGKNHRNYDFGFVGRLSFIDYKYSNSDIMFEPSVFVRYGYRNVKLMTQLGLRLNSHNGIHDYAITPITFGMGLYIQFNKNLKKTP